jgi:hypothetical protein
MMRASVSNPKSRITGDGVLHVTGSLIRNKKRIGIRDRYKIIEALVMHQLMPDFSLDATPLKAHTLAGKIASRNLKAIEEYREGF